MLPMAISRPPPAPTGGQSWGVLHWAMSPRPAPVTSGQHSLPPDPPQLGVGPWSPALSPPYRNQMERWLQACSSTLSPLSSAGRGTLEKVGLWTPILASLPNTTLLSHKLNPPMGTPSALAGAGRWLCGQLGVLVGGGLRGLAPLAAAPGACYRCRSSGPTPGPPSQSPSGAPGGCWCSLRPKTSAFCYPISASVCLTCSIINSKHF